MLCVSACFGKSPTDRRQQQQQLKGRQKKTQHEETPNHCKSTCAHLLALRPLYLIGSTENLRETNVLTSRLLPPRWPVA